MVGNQNKKSNKNSNKNPFYKTFSNNSEYLYSHDYKSRFDYESGNVDNFIIELTRYIKQ